MGGELSKHKNYGIKHVGDHLTFFNIKMKNVCTLVHVPTKLKVKQQNGKRICNTYDKGLILLL